METFFVTTPQLTIHCWAAGPELGTPILAIHGNLTTGRFFRALAEALPPDYRLIAPDLRAFGRTEHREIDATRGLRDWVDDLHGLLVVLGWTGHRRVHAIGWSLGGGIAQRYAIDYPDDLRTLTLIAPLSPFGFGGTKDTAGTLCFPDSAGCGGGAVAAPFVHRLQTQDSTDDDPPSSPRVTMRSYFWSPTHKAPDEDDLVHEMLLTWVDDGGYPGTYGTSAHWPGVTPGMTGINNAMAPNYCDLSALTTIERKPPILWIRGDQDQVVSDTSLFDFGMLGQLGAVPGWPGEQIFPPQPMIAQTRAVFDLYRAQGGIVREVVLPGCGHGPLIERAEAVATLWGEHAASADTTS